MSENTINPNHLLDITKKLKEAEKSDVPHLVMEDKLVSVVGDPNLTQVKKADYEIKFRLPMSKFDKQPENSIIVGPYYVVTETFRDATITPRSDLIIVDSVMKMQPFFKKLHNDGRMEDYSEAELLSIIAAAGEEIVLAMYNLVAVFLGIDDVLGQYMMPFSVLNAMVQLIENHPEVFNEAGDFFG